MSLKSKLVAAAVAVTLVGGVITARAPSAKAATPQCGPHCVGVFSRAFGTPDSPNFIETVYHGVAKVGQPTILQRANGSDPAEDFIVPRAGMVSDFFNAGMVSADVNRHYGSERAVQIEYAPLGAPSGLCAGLATTAYQNEGLSLQPCNVPGTTVWILDTMDSPATGSTYFPLVNGTNMDFVHPFGMTYPSKADPSHKRLPQIVVRHLLGNPGRVPDRQLWGSVFRVL